MYHSGFSKNNRHFLKKLLLLPWSMILIIIFTTIIGITLMYTAANGSWYPWANKQIIHLLTSLPIMIIIAITDVRLWFKMSYVIYILVLSFLAIIEFSGHTAMGATRWINLGVIKIQPSEIMKISLILALAKYFHNISQLSTNRIIYLIPPIIMIFIPFCLILRQPDLGTALILLALGTLIFFATGVSIRKFIVIIIAALIILPFSWNLLHDYQKKRVLTFLNPESDPLGAGYNIIQSKIAIGSGGIFGKGLLKGTQNQLKFLPEHHTDFIFTTFAEEFGFVGGIIILALYALLIIFGIFTANNIRNHYSRLIAIGITSLFFLHIFINMAMVMGLLPVVGVPLPLLSYGGTIMMTIFIGFGFLFNSYVHYNSHINTNHKFL
ncbi:Rod shape-determining protein RodA [Rickettsiales bacterium Ac37b]|nr:Rod shape-determining protein RodA [Rickettsiales bacterium Ac37b]